MAKSLICKKKGILGGIPCLRGTRIPVSLVLRFLDSGETLSDIISHYPYLTEEQLHAAVEYAIKKVGK